MLHVDIRDSSMDLILAVALSETPGVFSFSEGCPRLLNLLADRVLLAAYSRQLRPVPRGLVEAKAKEIITARSAGANPASRDPRDG